MRLILRYIRSFFKRKPKTINIHYKHEKEKGNLTETIQLLKKKNVFHKDYGIVSDKLSLFYCTLLFDLMNDDREYPIHKKKIRTILLMLNASTPYRQNGYCIRSEMIIKHISNLGYKVVVLTRPGFPWDLGVQLDKQQDLLKEVINGVTYYRCYPHLFLKDTPITQYIYQFQMITDKIIQKEQIDLVHACSNYIIGLSGLIAAKKLKLPFVYEIRGFWEKTKCTKIEDYYLSEEYLLQQNLETYIAKNAYKVVVIGKHLKDVLIHRGVNKQKIFHISNGVNDHFRPLDNTDYIKKYHLKNTFIIGYVGSIVKYEGLERILMLLKSLITDGIKDVRFLVAGSGPYLNTFLETIKSNNLMKYCLYIGVVKHKDVPKLYANFDLCIFPRLNEEVTNIVTPIKPLEAMSCKKCVIVSHLSALKEFVVNEENGLIFNHTNDDLKKQFLRVYNDQGLREKLALNGYLYVKKHKYYKIISKKYIDVYEDSD